MTSAVLPCSLREKIRQMHTALCLQSLSGWAIHWTGDGYSLWGWIFLHSDSTLWKSSYSPSGIHVKLLGILSSWQSMKALPLCLVLRIQSSSDPTQKLIEEAVWGLQGKTSVGPLLNPNRWADVGISGAPWLSHEGRNAKMMWNALFWFSKLKIEQQVLSWEARVRN